MRWLLLVSWVYAQQLVQGSAEGVLTPDLSLKQLQWQLKQKAIINALEQAFGTAVQSQRYLELENITWGQQAQTQSRFYTWSQTTVNGEWLKTLDFRCEQVGEEQGNPLYRCQVTGYARKIPPVQLPFKVSALKCPSLRCATSQFIHGSPFYMAFYAPSDGYVAAFLVNEDTAYRILPYQALGSVFPYGVPVKGEKTYLFFSPEQDQLYEFVPAYLSNYVDELLLTAEENPTLYQLYVLYAPKVIPLPLVELPSLSTSSYSIPAWMPAKAFHQWLFELRLKNPQVSIQILMLSIYGEDSVFAD